MKKIIIVAFFLFAMCLIIYYAKELVSSDEFKREKESVSIEEAEEEKLCYKFVTKGLLANGGVRTNFLDKPYETDYATGHEILSESQGLFMNYSALRKKQDIYETICKFTMENMYGKDIIPYRYDSKGVHEYKVNAAIDDLRIIYSLFEGAVNFNNKEYENEAYKLGIRLYKTNIINNQLYDFYDETYKQTNNFITLCYVDFYTMDQLSRRDWKWEKVRENMLSIVQSAYIGDEFPMFMTRYSYEDKKYSLTENINMIESLLTAYHLAQIKECPEETIKLLKEKIEVGKLFAYYKVDGTPTTTMESTAVYALSAMIGATLEDKDLYDKSITCMNRFQVMDKKSLIYGGFGNGVTNETYSFDNLMALMAYGMAVENE